MQLPPITKSQRQIIFYLYKFRYLTILQFQKLFNHIDSKRVREWLNDLQKKKYINVIKDEKDITKPYVFCLAQRAGHILKSEEDIDENFLNWLYKEKDKTEEFIQRNLFVADCYLYFLKNTDKNSKLSFFTKQDLKDYDYFPEDLPDAYIDLEENGENTRYFLELFEKDMLSDISRSRVNYYFKYSDEGTWQENTDNSSFPGLLIVCFSEKRKKHVYYYAKSLLEKTLNTDLEIFLTTKDNVKFAKEGINIWQKAE
ncbi:MAG: hypothetical protein M1365_17425 [Actinobacteria bacterium]|nr:hypothetical protein [Actinomycetota bacterium]